MTAISKIKNRPQILHSLAFLAAGSVKSSGARRFADGAGEVNRGDRRICEVSSGERDRVRLLGVGEGSVEGRIEGSGSAAGTFSRVVSP